MHTFITPPDADALPAMTQSRLVLKACVTHLLVLRRGLARLSNELSLAIETEILVPRAPLLKKLQNR